MMIPLYLNNESHAYNLAGLSYFPIMSWYLHGSSSIKDVFSHP